MYGLVRGKIWHITVKLKRLGWLVYLGQLYPEELILESYPPLMGK